MPVDNTNPNTIRIRRTKPSKAKYSKYRTILIKPGIQAIVGFKKAGGSEIQSFVFDKAKFDLDKAKAWVKSHNQKVKEDYSLATVMATALEEGMDSPILTPSYDKIGKKPVSIRPPLPGVNVYSVDSEAVRKTFESNFSQSGNHYKWNWIPESEIWIDQDLASNTSSEDFVNAVIGEGEEIKRMSKTDMKQTESVTAPEMPTITAAGTSKLPPSMNNDTESLVPDNVQELYPDIRFSNGKPNRERAITYLQQLGGLQKFLKDSDVAKIKRLLHGILRESHDVVLNEQGFNLQEGSQSFVADDFEAQIFEGMNESGVKKAKVRLIKTGESKNGNIYGAKCLKDAVPLFDGIPIYPNHIDGARGVQEKVGWYSNPVYVGDEESGEIQAIANIFESDPKMWEMVKEQCKNPEAKICGLSINAFGKGKVIQEEKNGKKRRVVESIVYADSTDIVDNPSAGGGVIELLESVRTKLSFDAKHLNLGEETMDEKTLREKHPDLVKIIEAKVKESKDSDGDDDSGKMQKCPGCGKSFKTQECVTHVHSHVVELETKLTEATNKATEMERKLSLNALKESVEAKLGTHKNLPGAMKIRLAEGLINLGLEQREGDKPSNWDAFIEAELNYANQLRASGTDSLVLGSDKNKVPSTNSETKLTEAEKRDMARKVAQNI